MSNPVASPMMEPTILLSRITTALGHYRYRFASEQQLHDGISQALSTFGIEHKREFVPSKEERFDFLCHEHVVIEVKIKGSMPEALRQVDRYCKLERVRGVVIAATRNWTRGYKRDFKLHGKPVRVVQIQPQAF